MKEELIKTKQLSTYFQKYFSHQFILGLSLTFLFSDSCGFTQSLYPLLPYITEQIMHPIYFQKFLLKNIRTCFFSCFQLKFISLVKRLIHYTQNLFPVPQSQLNFMLQILITTYALPNPPPSLSSNNVQSNPHIPIYLFSSFSSIILYSVQVQTIFPPLGCGTSMSKGVDLNCDLDYTISFWL